MTVTDVVLQYHEVEGETVGLGGDQMLQKWKGDFSGDSQGNGNILFPDSSVQTVRSMESRNERDQEEMRRKDDRRGRHCGPPGRQAHA